MPDLSTLNPLKRLELKRKYKEVFGTPEGKEVLAHILRVAGVTRPRFTSDNEMTRINEGERRLAMSIFKQVHSSTDHLIQLMQDEIDKQENTS